MNSINTIIENFVFIRPAWLVAFVPILLVYILKLKYGQADNLWQQLLPKHLYQKLIITKGIGKPKRFIHTAMLAWLVACIALAGPSWEKLPQAVYQTQAGKVLLMDMSMSMRATDISPNRLTRARFKAIDLLQQLDEGETGLIAYSGDAFVISPLTDDTNTLANLIPSLSPEIMPTQGSSALAGLYKSVELLQGAGYQSGDIYWLTDGINIDEAQDIRAFIKQSPFKVSALLIGTEEGAPIQLTDGKLLKDYNGSIVVPSVNERYMNQAMQGTSANFSLFANDNSDIRKIKRKVDIEQQQKAEKVENTSGDTQKDMGPYLVLLLLPIAAYAFRKGLLVLSSIAFLSSVSGFHSSPAYAQQNTVDSPANSKQTTNSGQSLINNTEQDAGTQKVELSFFDRWFKNPDQRGKQAYDAQDYEQASGLFENTEWQAATAYKQGDFETAANLYKDLPGVENAYNLGNALAKQMKLEEAKAAYDKVLSLQPEHKQANKNKAIVEELLKQQEQSEQQKEQDSQQNQDGQDGDSSEQQDSQNESQQEQDQASEQEDGAQSDDSQSSDDADSNEQSEQNADSPNQQNSQQNSQQQDDRDLQEEAQQQNQAPQASENNESNESNAAEDSQQNPDTQESSQQASDEGAEETAEQEAISSSQFQMENLTPEQQEEMQRMQMILNKVPDDPAYLLQRKMLLEAHRRKNTPAPPTQENW